MSQYHANNEQGFALISAMVFLVILTVIGVAALDMTILETHMSGNDRVYREDFYNQEQALATAKLEYKKWLDIKYLLKDGDGVCFPDRTNQPTGFDSNNDGITDDSQIFKNGKAVGSFRIRKNIKGSGNVSNWEDLSNSSTAEEIKNHPANKIPKLSHRDKPIPGTGYDPTNFEIRRFTITAYSPDKDRNVIVQEGVYKVFNKF